MANLASLVKAVAQVVGGGKPVLAQGDGKDVSKMVSSCRAGRSFRLDRLIGDALQIVPGLVAEQLG